MATRGLLLLGIFLYRFLRPRALEHRFTVVQKRRAHRDRVKRLINCHSDRKPCAKRNRMGRGMERAGTPRHGRAGREAARAGANESISYWFASYFHEMDPLCLQCILPRAINPRTGLGETAAGKIATTR